MSNNKAPAFQFYPKDFLTDAKVISMPAEVRGYYITLLCVDWIEDGVPVDRMGALCGFQWIDEQGQMRSAEHYERAMALLSECFVAHPSKPGCVTNPRLQKERERQAEKRAEKVEAGKRGARTRWINKLQEGDDGTAIAVPFAENGTAIVLPMANDSSSSSSSSSDLNNTPLIAPPSGEPPPPPPKRARRRKLTAADLDRYRAGQLPEWFGGKRAAEVEQLCDLLVWLTPKELEDFTREHGDRWVGYWVVQLDNAFQATPELFGKYSDHAAVMRNWHKREIARGKVFAIHPKEGPGYYPEWQAKQWGAAQ